MWPLIVIQMVRSVNHDAPPYAAAAVCTTAVARRRSCATPPGGELEPIQLQLGHASVQTTVGTCPSGKGA